MNICAIVSGHYMLQTEAATFTVRETAKLLRIGINQTYEAVKRGDIPAIRIGDRWHVLLGLRITPEMKKRLEAEATRKGRSLSQEAEIRLEMSFEMQTAVDFLKAEILPRLLAHPPGLAAAKGEAPTHAEAEMTLAELVVEGRHLSGDPNLTGEEALAYLDLRGNDQAHVMLIDLIYRRVNAEAKRLKAEQLRRQAATPEPKVAKK